MEHLAVLWILCTVQNIAVVTFELTHIFSKFQMAGINIYAILVNG